jgi:hypothetical protein
MSRLELHEHELLRARWRRFRDRQRLADPEAVDLGLGGLGRHVPNLSVRFLVLPADPEATVISFDDDFWQWWGEERPNPFHGRPADWGNYRTPTAEAAVRHDQLADDRWSWDTYLALHRSGTLEFGLGGGGARHHRDEHVFFLIAIVGHIWVALSHSTASLERFGIGGPWELTVALRGTRGAQLGDLADGWAGPFDLRGRHLPKNPHPHLLHVREVFEWPKDADGLRSLVFHFGDVVEDSWGRPERRYLSNTEPRRGTFDASRF